MKYTSKKINKSVFQINRTIFSSASIDPIIRVPLIDTSDIENKGKKFRFLPIHPFPFSPLLYFYVSGVRAHEGRFPRRRRTRVAVTLRQRTERRDALCVYQVNGHLQYGLRLHPADPLIARELGRGRRRGSKRDSPRRTT